MQIKQILFLIAVVNCSLALIGCASDSNALKKSDELMFSMTNSTPSSVYEIRVYVIGAGDTASKIANKFQISLKDFEAMNPDLKLNRLYIGQIVKIYEKQIN
jgi:peptidoglycan endopeptidase LytF